MPIHQVADFVFSTSRFTMVADGQKVADFDVQRFGPNGCWPVVATIGPKGTTWSVYYIDGQRITSEREQSSDGSVEAYGVAVALPLSLEDRERWAFSTTGLAVYASPSGVVERGSFVYRNAVWATTEDDTTSPVRLVVQRLYWLEQYTEKYPSAPETQYERLHIFQAGVGLVAYLDMQWPGGPKWVTRK